MPTVALPPLIDQLATQLLTEFCARRSPPHLRDQVRTEFTIVGNKVTIANEVFSNTISKAGAENGDSVMKDILRDLEAVSREKVAPPPRPLIIDGYYTTHKGTKIRVEVSLWNDNTVRLSRR